MSNHRKRILIVHWDDDELISLEHLLEDRGFETVTTWDLQEGMKLLRSRHFDLIVAADHEPQLAAGEILREVQSRVPCIILRNGTHSDPAYFLALGAKAVLFAWERETLINFVQEIVGKATTAVLPGVAAD
jgi:DNA-binding response OmpR family regulator